MTRDVSVGGTISQSVVVTGDGNTVTLSFGATLRLPLARRQIWRQVRHTNPLDVLNPARGHLPLLGRETELATLRAWLETSEPVSVHALIAPAGTGKTRLAIGLCESLDGEQKPGANGWVAGFISPSALPALADAHETQAFQYDVPTLVVIDYAAQEAQALARWLDHLTRHPMEPGQKLRILLLEREAPEGFGWWADLTGSRLGSARDRLDLFHDPSLRPTPLTGLSDVETRRQVIAAALAATERLQGASPCHAAIPTTGADPAYDAHLTHDRFGTPLALAMAGLIAWDRGPTDALALRHLEAARHLAGRELDRLKSLAGKNQADAIAHLVAFNGLAGGVPVTGLNTTLTEELNAVGLSGDVGALAALLQQDLPSPPTQTGDAPAPARLGTIQPDLIGEGVVIEAFERTSPAHQAEGAATVQRAYTLGGAVSATAFMRLLQDYGFALEDPTATDTDKATAARVMGWLRALADAIEDPEALEPLAFALPPSTLVLREDTLNLTDRLAKTWKRRAEDTQSMADVAHAALWANNLANRLSALGRREEALAVAEEAVRLYRALAQTRPDAVSPNLAASLNNVANFLSDLGRREDALAAAEEAVRLYRALAQARPDAFMPDLATSLNNVANFLSALGRREDALAAAEDAVRLYRALAQARPDAFTVDLSTSLGVLGDVRMAAGDTNGAFLAISEAIDVLAPVFLRLPRAVGHWMAMHLQRYRERAEALGRAPDMEKLAPIVAVFETLLEDEG